MMVAAGCRVKMSDRVWPPPSFDCTKDPVTQRWRASPQALEPRGPDRAQSSLIKGFKALPA